MEKEELLAVKVRKINEVAESLRQDVDKIHRGMKALLDHHKMEWEEPKVVEYYEESGTYTDIDIHTVTRTGKQQAHMTTHG